MSAERCAHVEIGKAENGRPSLKINGAEQNNLISNDVTLRWVEEPIPGHWELTVTYLEVEAAGDVRAEIHEGAL